MISSHNHELEPFMSRFMVAHRSLNMDMKRRLEANTIVGIRLGRALGCLKFKQVHPHSRAAYKEFNDVVSFDTTYLVNRYKLPFATIIGVNHHRQSILLGCTLISCEDANTFKWLVMTWLEAMGDIHPNAILTYQCEGMRKTIRQITLKTRHRFCLWHILCKILKKFRGFIEYESACLEFKAVIYDSLAIKMFERNWNEFMVKNGLEKIEWLSKLCIDKEYWFPIYLNHTFWVGMVSTQRSQSKYAYFDGYVNSMSTLKQFVE
ncbi:hypothetical protein GH714_019487 [Hevea brasiliensis]|uniref:Protein FAR1-RELATED SEQUENCE n=1 Tax=Hevea brasiliensis TaxID=3981 RepID=A0A6A6N8S2_HEVBR|nr:hypothetical protein GH714_019487 [Hevea brasiliensis]